MTPEHVADSQTNVINYWALKIQKNKIKTLIEEGPVTVGNSEGMKGKKKKAKNFQHLQKRLNRYFREEGRQS